MLSERLKRVRKELRKSQKEMAAALGVSYPAWQGYEQGKNEPGSAVIEALTKIGFNANWILTGEGKMRRERQPLEEDEEITFKNLDDKGFYPDFDSRSFALCMSVILDYQDKFQVKFSHEKHSRLLYTLWNIMAEQKAEWQTEEKGMQLLQTLLKISDDFEFFRQLNMSHRPTHAFLAYLENPDSFEVPQEQKNRGKEAKKSAKKAL